MYLHIFNYNVYGFLSFFSSFIRGQEGVLVLGMPLVSQRERERETKESEKE